MTFLVDANVVVYAAADSPYRTSCVDILGAIARGDAKGRLSVSVLEEVWHIELSGRAGDLSGLTERTFTIFRPLLPVTDAIVERALALTAPKLGANDRIHASTCFENGIAGIVTADAGFDGIRGLRRIDPLDTRAIRSLLG